MRYLHYRFQHGRVINRFLISERWARPIRGEAVTIDGAVNVWEGTGHSAAYVNPVREAFLSKRRQDWGEYPTFTEKEVGGSVVRDGEPFALAVHFPFADPVISLSGFYSTPTWIGATAITFLEAEEACALRCEFAVCGGARLWLNQEPVVTFTPYVRNQSPHREIVLALQQGMNELVVVWDEFAERDSESSFSLTLCEPTALVTQHIPVGDRDTSRINGVEAALGDLSCRSNHVRAGDIELFCPNPYESEELVIALIGATEENFMVGDLREATAVFPPKASHCSLGPCEDFPIGYLQFKATTVVEGLVMSYRLAFENFPLSLVPPMAETIEGRKEQALAFLARHGERNGNRAVAMLHAGGPREEFEHILRRQITFINKRSDCSDFYLPYLIHILTCWHDHPFVTQDLKDEMKQCILNFRYWHDEPGDDAMWFYTENHALMFHVCQLLAGELYPDEVFTNSGMTGSAMQQKAIGLLNGWFDTFFSIGFTEWNSPAYLPINSLGFANLYAQTTHAAMRDVAKRALDYLFYLLAVYSLDGIFCTTAGRTYPKELFGNNSNCPSFINWIGYGLGNTSHAGKGVVALCFSTYQPPADYRKFITVESGRQLITQSTHGYNGHANVYACKTASSHLTSANNFRVGERGYQENPIHLLCSPTEQMWVNHPGEYNVFGSGRPSYWAGNGSLPRVNQWENFASVVFHIPASHPVGFTHVYLPTMEFKRWEKRGRWIFAESHNGSYVAVCCSSPMNMTTYGPNKEREFITEGRRVTYLLRVGSRRTHVSLEEFSSSMIASLVEIGEDSYVFEDAALGRLAGGWDRSLTVDGTEISYGGFDPVGENTWGTER